jgi:hypothetical protein
MPRNTQLLERIKKEREAQAVKTPDRKGRKRPKPELAAAKV